MSAPPLRVGLLGCGQIARGVHLRVLGRLPGVRVAALAEPDPAACAAAVALAPGAAPFADWRALVDAGAVDAGAVDAVVVCLPPDLHATAAVAAFAAGLHIYLEKPLAPTLAEGTDVLRAWRAAGTVGAVGFNVRLSPFAEAARAHVAAGDIGTPVAARTVFTGAGRDLPAWKRRRATGRLVPFSHSREAFVAEKAVVVTRACAELGYAPQNEVADAVRAMVALFRASGDLAAPQP